jgi:DNA-binding NarL/FixJ family response regulator
MIAHCGSVGDALRILTESCVDIVLLDMDLGEERGSEFLIRAREDGFRGPVIVVSAGLSEREAKLLLNLGVAGIILKHSSPELLYGAIREVMAGRRWMDQRLGTPTAASERGRARKLTPREREVLRAVFQGLSNKEAAKRLGLSESLVKAALQQLFQKAGVRTRGQLIRAALEQYFDQL